MQMPTSPMEYLWLTLTMQEEWPLLIVAPASLRLAWAEELERWLPHLRPSTIHVIQGKVDRMGQDFNPQVQPSTIPWLCASPHANHPSH